MRESVRAGEGFGRRNPDMTGTGASGELLGQALGFMTSLSLRRRTPSVRTLLSLAFSQSLLNCVYSCLHPFHCHHPPLNTFPTGCTRSTGWCCAVPWSPGAKQICTRKKYVRKCATYRKSGDKTIGKSFPTTAVRRHHVRQAADSPQHVGPLI